MLCLTIIFLSTIGIISQVCEKGKLSAATSTIYIAAAVVLLIKLIGVENIEFNSELISARVRKSEQFNDEMLTRALWNAGTPTGDYASQKNPNRDTYPAIKKILSKYHADPEFIIDYFKSQNFYRRYRTDFKVKGNFDLSKIKSPVVDILKSLNRPSTDNSPLRKPRL